MPTHTTGSGGRRLIDPLDHHPQPRRLLAHVAGELPVWPLAARLVGLLVARLVGLLAQAHPGLELTHVPHRDPRDPVGVTAAYHCARRLAQQSALSLVALRAERCLALVQASAPARSRLTTIQLPPQENTAYSPEQLVVSGQGAMHLSTEAQGFLASCL